MQISLDGPFGIIYMRFSQHLECYECHLEELLTALKIKATQATIIGLN